MDDGASPPRFQNRKLRTMLTQANLRINRKTYEWTGRALALLEKVLRVNIKLHERRGQVAEGDIFLFNHFARFETFIPQYLIHRETGALCRSVAAEELFQGDPTFARYLLNLGAVPTDYEGLLPFLTAEVLRGRKVVLFPEGGMVKDRRVLDRAGRYSIFSRSSLERRKHHTGAAVVALAVDGFKAAVRDANRRGQAERLLSWVRRLGLPSTEELVAAAEKPTVILPCNITFFPIRITENPLRRLAEQLNRGMSPRLSEELLIEGNILLRDTDMDLRLGEPIRPSEDWSFLDRALLDRVARGVDSWEEFFRAAPGRDRWAGRWHAARARKQALRTRDRYMVEMYERVTVNLSHLASRIVFRLLDRAVTEMEEGLFHRILYLAVKNVQHEPTVHLHRSLRNPEAYTCVLSGPCSWWLQFLETASAKGLIESAGRRYRFLAKLRQEHGFDEIRLENLVAVYANEVEPLAAVTRAVDAAIAAAPRIEPRALGRQHYDDQERSYRWDWEAFRKPRHEAVNRDELATESGAPFFFLPEKGAKSLGVLLVHGFTASPAEVRPLGDRLAALGYPCLGVRLKGHGTSPWDLRERRWEEWLASVWAGYETLAAFADAVCVVGFSAGGSLALRLAAEAPRGLAGVAAVCAPLLWRDKGMSLVPMVHGANVVLEHFGAGNGLLPFHHDRPEHPEINYLHKPVEALYELKELVREMEGHLRRVRCPVLLVQANDDPTVDPESVDLIYQGLGTARKTLVMVPSARHGILYENIGGTQEKVLDFVGRLEPAP
ncbi:MAG: alpha/beta fold hydrolase [Deltaproteobacteria bacterium]|nr:alpha/beta fold hydrolase [Deltaproteobacteria bacterium]